MAINKSKRYDEAIKVAKSKIKNDKDHVLYEEDIIDIFPELKESKESEDEKIRKLLITLFINDYGKNSNARFAGIKVKDIISWLEKQGVQKPDKIEPKFKIGDLIKYDEDGEVNRVVEITSGGYKLEHGSHILCFSSQDYWELCGRLYTNKDLPSFDESQGTPILKQGEQKPAELGENRSKELSLSLQIQAYLNTASDELYAKGKPIYSEERLKDIHKCMQMWQKLHNAYFYQKPAWTEEDEKEVAVLEAYIRSKDWSESHIDRALGIVDELVNKVAFLRPQNTQNMWKPTKKQLMALRWVLNYIPYGIHKEEISGLFDQIKDL